MAFVSRIAIFVGATACAVAHKSPLPDVDTVLTKATGRAQDFAAQAAAMQRRVAEQQDKSKKMLTEQKMEYEKKLQEQAAASAKLAEENKAISEEIKDLKGKAATLKNETASLQKQDKELRDAISKIKEVNAEAGRFIAESLKVTDDSNADELHVLMPTTPKPTLEHFMSVAESSGVSLLQLTMRHVSSPDELLNTLSSSLADIKTAAAEGQVALKASFLASLDEGKKKQEKLLSEQAALNATRATERTLVEKLRVAKGHLQKTQSELKQRLEGLSLFAQAVHSTATSGLSVSTPKPAEDKASAFLRQAPKPANTTAQTASAPAKVNVTPAQPAAAQPAPVATAPNATRMVSEQAHQAVEALNSPLSSLPSWLHPVAQHVERLANAFGH